MFNELNIDISTVRTFLDFTAMFDNYDLNRRNFKFLSAFIVLNFSIFKIMATIFTTVCRMSYELIRSFNHFKSLSRMTFLATSFFATYCAATLRFRSCLKIKLNPTIWIGLIHLNRKTLALNR